MRQVHSNLKIILQLPDLPADYQPLTEPEFFAEGTGNSHWLLNTQAGKLIWRQFGNAPGVDHQREIQLLTRLQSRPWAPRLLLAIDNLGLLMRLAEGEHPVTDRLTASQRQSLINLAIQLWQTAIQMPIKAPDQVLIQIPSQNYPQLLENYWQLAGGKEATRPLLDQLIAESQSWPKSCYRLTHHDLHGGNLLLNNQVLNKEEWTLLDWEYAAWGNPWIDAVSLDRFMKFTAEEKAQLEAVLPAMSNYNKNDAWTKIGQWLADLDLLWKTALESH